MPHRGKTLPRCAVITYIVATCINHNITSITTPIGIEHSLDFSPEPNMICKYSNNRIRMSARHYHGRFGWKWDNESYAYVRDGKTTSVRNHRLKTALRHRVIAIFMRDRNLLHVNLVKLLLSRFLNLICHTCRFAHEWKENPTPYQSSFSIAGHFGSLSQNIPTTMVSVLDIDVFLSLAHKEALAHITPHHSLVCPIGLGKRPIFSHGGVLRVFTWNQSLSCNLARSSKNGHWFPIKIL